MLDQNPAPGSRVAPSATITLNLFEVEKSPATAASKIPNLVGLSVREALQKLSRLKVEAVVNGSGRVVRQYPGAGTVITRGMRCEIECQTTIPAVKPAVVH